MKFSENIEHVRCLAHLLVKVVVCIGERIAFGVTNSCRHLVLAILQSLLLLGVSTIGVEAQVDNWGGTVTVSESSIPIEPGQSNTYRVRLNKPPTEAGVDWFVMVHINGVRYTGGVYKDLSLIPGFYRTFDTDDWNTWKDFRITRAGDDYTGERAGRVTLTHEVWDHNSNCPVHGVGSVTVTGGNNGGGNNGGGNNGGGNNGGGNNGGGNNGGGNNGGENNGEPPPVLPPPAVSVADASAVEGDRLGFVVTLSPPSDEPVTVRYGTASGTAEEGVDYEATSGVLSFGPGIVQRTVEVQSREDELDERDETFTVGLSEPVGALLGNAVGVGTIVDNDEPPPVLPPPAVSVADASAVEGDRLGFVVTLSPPSDEPVTVRYGTASGTAEEGVDYEATSGVLSFGPGIVQRTVEVQSREDELDERDETFTVGLSEPVGALLGNAVGVGTIVDNDEPPPVLPPPAVSVADASAVEGDRLGFVVTLAASFS